MMEDRPKPSNLAVVSKTLTQAARARSDLFAARHALAAKVLLTDPGDSGPISVPAGTAPRPVARLAPGLTLRCGAGLDEALAGGWNRPEDWGVWTSATRARLRFRIEDPSSLPFVVDVAVTAFLSGEGTQALRITAPTGQLAVIGFGRESDGKIVTLLLTRDDLDEAGIIELQVETAHVASPEALGQNGDRRLLGVAISTIDVRRLPGKDIDQSSATQLPVLGRDMPITPARNLSHALRSGWSHLEEAGVWSIANVATIAFALSPAVRLPCEIELDLYGFVPDGQPVQVAVVGPARTLARTQFDSRVTRRGVSFSLLASDDTAEERQVCLTILVSRNAAPSDLGASTDTRRLGVGLASITLKGS